MAVTGAILPKQYANAINRHEKAEKKIVPLYYIHWNLLYFSFGILIPQCLVDLTLFVVLQKELFQYSHVLLIASTSTWNLYESTLLLRDVLVNSTSSSTKGFNFF